MAVSTAVAADGSVYVAIYTGFAAIYTPEANVRAGDWIAIYVTGLGAVNGAATDGQAPGIPPPQVAAPVTVTLGTMTLDVAWAGLAPGYAGLYQVNALVPASAGSGFMTLPLTVSAGGKTSNPAPVPMQ